jgi:NAD(P)-dependent dehydrogenase (short-subunit alcohol dehydrogenase family)
MTQHAANSLEGKVAIVTGANQGLGLEIARGYLAAGASVVICARDGALLAEARADLSKRLRSPQAIESISADVSNQADVAALVDKTLDLFGRIDILVNNAGIYGPAGASEEVSWDAWVRAIEINLFGSVLMIRAVLPVMKRQKSGKIVQLSGGGATKPLPNLSAYAVSKAGIARFVETVAEETRDFGVNINAIAPGALNTRMLEEVLAAGPEKVGRDFFQSSVKQKESGGAGFASAVDLAVFLGSSASDGITGKLISALWDKWYSWPDHLDELSSTDVYTLRRITGRERGLAWGDK